MDASDQIVDVFDRLNALSPSRLAARSFAERFVWYVVATRCEIDINGFASVYEQLLGQAELDLLIDGLQRIGEKRLAAQFHRGVELLEKDGFYGHREWKRVSARVKKQIGVIGERVGSRLWDLDENLANLLNVNSGARRSK